MRTGMAAVLAVMMGMAWLGAAAEARASDGVLPVAGSVVTPFAPPAERWGSGHRGVDIAALAGSAVSAPDAGVVTFAGLVAGRPVVVVDHGGVRSTLEPVEAGVGVGTRVTRGQQVGVLVTGHDCPADVCLHWGLLRGEQYLDPLSLMATDAIVLLPDGAAAGVRQRAAAREAAAAAIGAAQGSGILQRPVAAPITSPFGLRFHPIFHEWRLHAGVDLSAPCGTPIRAADDGVVTHAAYDSSGGWRLVISHGSVDGATLATSYLHAQGYSVRPGQAVTRGQVVGTVGSTGWSTGCHLHFSVKVDGRHVDPQQWIG